MRPEIWERHCKHAEKVLPSALAGLFRLITQPFVSITTSIASDRASFFDGRLLLVGDALALFRPHLGSSTIQAAMHVMLLGRMRMGEVKLETWEEQTMEFAHMTRLGSIAFGNGFMYGYPTILASKANYYWMVAMQTLWRFWYGSAHPLPSTQGR